MRGGVHLAKTKDAGAAPAINIGISEKDRGAIAGGEQRRLSHLPLGNERVQCDAAGQVVLNLKTPWRDGTTRLVMSPPELMKLPIQRLLCGS